MHHSRLQAIVIDCLDEHFEDCVRFWSAALGQPPTSEPTESSERPRYVDLGTVSGPLKILLQRVPSDHGVHLDVETDSTKAESARLEANGARRKAWVKRWWVMQDPSGNAFCVVAPQSTGFSKNARLWE